MKLRTYSLKVNDMLLDSEEPIDDNSNDTNRSRTRSLTRIVYYKESTRSKKKLYKVKIFIEGKDLPYVKQVKYTLHSTFGKNRVKIITRKPGNLECGLVIWTWGVFTVQVEIEDIKGNIIKMDHRLTFGEQLRETSVKVRNIIHKKS